MLRRVTHLPRLFVDRVLPGLATVKLSDAQRHKLRVVLRLGPGNMLRIFDGSGGEWVAQLEGSGGRSSTARIVEALKAHCEAACSHTTLLALSPLASLEATRNVCIKATELGVDAILPVVSERTQRGAHRNSPHLQSAALYSSPDGSAWPQPWMALLAAASHPHAGSCLPLDKVAGYVIEASEQCERRRVPALLPEMLLSQFLGCWSAASMGNEPTAHWGNRALFVAHEGLSSVRHDVQLTDISTPPQSLLRQALVASQRRRHVHASENCPNPQLQAAPCSGERSLLCLLVGPEGGWSPADTEALLAAQARCRIHEEFAPTGTLRHQRSAAGNAAAEMRTLELVSLGPHILRAETAAIAGLAVISAAVDSVARHGEGAFV